MLRGNGVTKHQTTSEKECSTYLQKLIGRSSALDIYAQTHAQEALQFPRERIRLLQCWSAVRRDEVEGFERLLVEVWRLVLDHLDGHDAERPDVDLGTILLLLDDLGSHPVRRADHRRTLRLLVRKLGAETEIGCALSGQQMDTGYRENEMRRTDLDMALSVEKNVV